MEKPSGILSEAHVKAIGELVVEASKIDSLFTDLIAAVTNMNIIHAIATVHHQQSASKLDTLRALLHLLWGADKEFQPITDLLNKAKVAVDFRNSLVHANWAIDENGTIVAVRFQARGELKRTRTPVSSKDIEAHVREARAVVEDLAKLRDHLNAARQPQGQMES